MKCNKQLRFNASAGIDNCPGSLGIITGSILILPCNISDVLSAVNE